MKELTRDTQELEKYLKTKDWLNTNETIISTEIPGEGNMNFTLRIRTGKRSLIIKQSRNYVEKYPQVAAPEERVLREAEFYEITKVNQHLSSVMPTIIGLDKENNSMAMEDLGAGKDYSYCYKKGEEISKEELTEIIDFVVVLHQNFSTKTVSKIIYNKNMRKLNHEHIFKYPYMEDNGIDLNAIIPGLATAGASLKNDEELKKEVEALGKHYLADGNTLLHGDYFPGSWLKTESGIKIIDPEFCFFGFPEFEIGVMLAHLKMADQPSELIDWALAYYTSKNELDIPLCQKFVSIEIIRRILGLAQLPLEIGLEKRKALLKEAKEIILLRK